MFRPFFQSLALGLLFSLPVHAGSQVAAQLERADAAYAAGDWSTYRAVYANLSRQSPGRGEYWYRLGRAHQALGNAAAAIRAFERALATGYLPAQTRLRLAVLSAGLGQAEAAVVHFEAARAAKLVNAEQALLGEPALKALLDDPCWRARLYPQLPAEADRLARWRSDLQFLDRRLRETHWQLFAQVPRAEWQAAWSSLRADLPTLADWQIAVRLMALVRLGRAGHTHLLPPFQGDAAFHAADLRLQWFADGLYILAAPASQSALVGRRVLRIGSGEPEAVLAALRAVIPHDSDSGLRAFSPLYLTMPELLMHCGFAEQRETLTLTLATSDGEAQQVELAATKLSMERLQAWLQFVEAPPHWVLARDVSTAAPRWLKHSALPFWLDDVPQSGLLYAQLNAVRDGEQESLADFAGRLQLALQDDRIDGLVLDLRHNRSGNGELLEPLLQALIASPKLHARGAFYVLIGGRTFSAAALLIGDLERQLDPLFVGESSAAGPTHVGEDNLILLPNTGLAALAASRLFVRSFSDDGRDNVAPHLAVAPRFADYQTGKDVVWQALLADRESRHSVGR
jgi:tetratricopeptide (TPR) repeat protein